ncbi:hypothetical protein LUZ63_012752 [Rhynchospora breviuscula]|uniref:Uncharacterized protein n=1 Tax=Rhynchospora breviuscula TaxID=2022672 RepID=A0A9Q0C7E6_9POAL|nr:hypothetical protein LUZ63_012752 [Rhynchospora breviuscula]
MEASKEGNNSAPAQGQCVAKADSQGKEVEIPSDSSPYVQYENLEDYKTKGYGTSGHLPTVDPPCHAGATDAPTPSGSTVSK